MLNLGCGQRFRQGWTNVDFVSFTPDVIAADLGKGIPFPDAEFSVVYHSHVLEHFAKEKAPVFIGECHRVLQPGGVLRVVVPDLEGIARQYLACLEKAASGDPAAVDDYDWMMLEMFDQVARNRAGGEMARFLKSGDVRNEDFVIRRCGLEVRQLLEEGKRERKSLASPPAVKTTAVDRLKCLVRIVLRREPRREFLLRRLLGDEYEALDIGRFRMRGENHAWMYDSFSLSRLLTEAGFKDVIERSASESYIEGWSDFHLDTEPDGQVYKPDSVFVEARKP